MFTRVTFKTADPGNPNFVGIPESMEAAYRDGIISKMKLTGKIVSEVVHVDFTTRAVASEPLACGARNYAGQERVCRIVFKGFMPGFAAQRAIKELLFNEGSEATISVSWHLKVPVPQLQRA